MHLVDAAIAPLRWIERARGGRRVALLAAYLFVVVAVGTLIAREVMLYRIPDCPEPVDSLGADRVILADDDNAATFYERAGRVVRTGPEPIEPLATYRRSWSSGFRSPAISGYVEANPEALRLWLAGTERSDAWFAPPPCDGRASLSPSVTQTELVDELGMLASCCRQEAGDIDGAWRYLRGYPGTRFNPKMGLWNEVRPTQHRFGTLRCVSPTRLT